MIPAFIADRENRKRRGEFDQDNHVGADIGNYSHIEFDDDDDDDDEIVMEMKGGSPPPAPSPMAEANAQMALERERARLALEAEERARRQQELERMERISKSRSLQSQAFSEAQNYGREQIAARGIDQGLANRYNLDSLYSGAVNRTRMGIAEDDLNPMSAYNMSGMFNDAYNTAVGTYRGDVRKQLYDVANDGFEYQRFADTADDDILMEILTSRKNDALAQIDMAKSRGQLNDIGYSRALNMLNQQGESAMADLQDLGLGVLAGYRKDLLGMRDNELKRIDSLDFSNPYDVGSFSDRLGTRVNDYQNRMRGDLFRATKDQAFFDPSTIISGSGAIQGYYNPTSQNNNQQPGGGANPLLDAFTNQSQQQQQQKNSGLNGVF